MQLYNASTGVGLRNFARRFAGFSGTNTSSYPDADVDASLNAYYDIFVTEILKAMDDWDFQGEVATASLVANQQEYTFPTDILKIKRIEVTFDGTNWKKATFFDINETGEATDTASIRENFSVNEPFVDLHDNSLFLYPVPSASVTGGIKIWYEKLPTQLSSAGDEPVFVRTYHVGLAYGAAKDYLEQHIEASGNAARLQTANNNLEVAISRMKEFYNKKNQDREYVVEPAYIEYDYGY